MSELNTRRPRGDEEFYDEANAIATLYDCCLVSVKAPLPPPDVELYVP